MNLYLMTPAAALQGLFTTTAEALGKATSFIQRRRRLTAAGFAQTLVFRWMGRPKTTPEALARELGVSPQALRQRLGAKAQAFLLALLTEALGKALKVRPERLAAPARFPAVVVEDTTVIALPAGLADEFPGCGGRGAGEGAAALKVLPRWDVRSGEVLALSVHAGRVSDRGLAATAADLPEGALHLADQGFFNAQRWRGMGPGRFWISRVPARTRVFWRGAWRSLGAVLGSLPGEGFDGAVRLVERADLACRLVARRCPPEVVARRRRKPREYTRGKKGREPSAAQLLLCDWLVFATNVADDRLGPKELWVVYRCRWQVELLFKRAKSLAGWAAAGAAPARGCWWSCTPRCWAWWCCTGARCWGGGPLNGVSPWKRLCEVQEFARGVQDSLAEGVATVARVLAKLARQLAGIRPQPRNRKRPSTRQLLLNPELAR